MAPIGWTIPNRYARAYDVRIGRLGPPPRHGGGDLARRGGQRQITTMESHTRLGLAVIAAVTVGIAVPPSAPSQETDALSAGDSARLRVAVIQVLSEKWTEGTRLWVTPPGAFDTASREWRGRQLYAAEWEAITRAFPTTIGIAGREAAFACPPGGVVMMPFSGCPIKEEGVIILLSELVLEADGTVSTSGGVIQSEESRTWRVTYGMIFRRDDKGGWEYVWSPWVSMTDG